MFAWLIVFASVDRYLSSSRDARRRQFCATKTVRRAICILGIIVCLSYSQALYCYEANLPIASSPCYAKSDQCRVFNDWFFLVFYNLTPPVIMLIFGALTLKNLRHAQQRQIQAVSSTTMDRSIRYRKRDFQLIIMLLTQVILFTITILPHSAQRIYSTLTSNSVKTSLTIATDNLWYQSAVILTSLPTSITFYLCILSTKRFREELCIITQLVYRKMKY
ncbi:unnamed protein product [Didymodactylos carnosus]|uniref:G-protein coupled receptors family 1 profile domain-containing protein n=1 Tax=Didymodactylos carnosus TaxID=1234261 RepID=A0A8S2R1A8_9BILA|nr:unnamed protein product [Didymodactylos carnosus]CAF4138413.1 unnamed protein product [Didymodactylos carnosus]